MGFSENYTCSTLEEIQSAYWNSSTVTLHLAVIYYHRDHAIELKHSSYVYVSEVLHHNASMVISIIDKLVKTVKAVVQNIEYIHFWTDSPISQYRNKTMFMSLADFLNSMGHMHHGITSRVATEKARATVWEEQQNGMQTMLLNRERF